MRPTRLSAEELRRALAALFQTEEVVAENPEHPADLKDDETDR